MSSENSLPNRSFFPLLMKGYFVGTVVSALVLYVTLAFVAPGDAGTWAALTDGGIFVAVLLVIGAVGLVVFPLAAIASWPFRDTVSRQPVIALISAGVFGILVGRLVTATEFQIGPGDYWSGSLVGFTYGVVWFLIVKLAGGRTETTIG